VEIGARLVGEDELELWVQDDGRGLPAEWIGTGDYGLGLSNTVARLAALPGATGTLAIARVPAGGTRATVLMNRRASSATAMTDSPRRQVSAAAR
jgi:signal transduction histidine kinase